MRKTPQRGMSGNSSKKITKESSNRFTLQHVEEAMCLLCEDTDRRGSLWRHEDGRHCVAGGSSDPYHLASLIWSQLLGEHAMVNPDYHTCFIYFINLFI